MEQDLFEIDVESIFGGFGEMKLNEKNMKDVQKFINKYKNVDCSIKTLVGNLIFYDENKNKENPN